MTPLRVATAFEPVGEEVIAKMMRRQNADRATVLALIEGIKRETVVWVNSELQVQVRELPNCMVHLTIMRRDSAKIFRDWPEFQAIKNQVIGDECEAVELYPAESRLVDTSSKYHMWGSRDPSFRFPFGFRMRSVSA